MQQCAAPLMSMQRDVSLDAQLVARAAVSSSSTSVPTAAPGFRHVSGVVSDADGPIADAFVDYEPIMDFPAAFTWTDSAGRFLLCGLPDGQSVTLGAGKSGRVGWATVPAGQSSGVDILLPR